jgi:hypothetical protein
METLAFILFVTMQCNSTGVVRVSMEVLRLPSNDDLRPNTLQYIDVVSYFFSVKRKYIYIYNEM